MLKCSINRALCPVILHEDSNLDYNCIYEETESSRTIRTQSRIQQQLEWINSPASFLYMTITTVLNSVRGTSFLRVSKLAASFATLKGQRSLQLFFFGRFCASVTDGRIVSWDRSYTGPRQPFSGHLNIHRALQSDRQAKRDEINRPAESFCKAPFQFCRDHSCISPTDEYVGLSTFHVLPPLTPVYSPILLCRDEGKAGIVLLCK